MKSRAKSSKYAATVALQAIVFFYIESTWTV